MRESRQPTRRMLDRNVSSTSNRADVLSYDVTLNLMMTTMCRTNISGLTVFQYFASMQDLVVWNYLRPLSGCAFCRN